MISTSALLVYSKYIITGISYTHEVNNWDSKIKCYYEQHTKHIQSIHKTWNEVVQMHKQSMQAPQGKTGLNTCE